MPLSHIGISTSDIASFSKFYNAALAPLGYTVAVELQDGKLLGYCDGTGPNFWIHEVSGDNAEKAARPIHFAFDCKTREDVDAFYNAAIAVGGKDNGPPGLRPLYAPGYYGAFVLDPEGNNVEAVNITHGEKK